MKFEKMYDWALIPESIKYDAESEFTVKNIYEKNFRWLRNDRTPALCSSYRKAYEIGWVIRSPVNIDLSPIHEVQLANSDDKAHIMSLCNFDSIWTRDSVAFGIKTDMNFGAYEFQDSEKWESMFILNGQSTLEWRLGFKCHPESEYSILVTEDFECEPIGIIPGLLGKKHMGSTSGMSIAIRPFKNRKVMRGDVIARLIPVANVF